MNLLYNFTLCMIILACVLVAAIKHKETYVMEYGRMPVQDADDDTLLDTNQSSCLYYLSKHKGWGSLFGNDEEGRKRKNIIAGFKMAQGEAVSERNEVEIPYYDACVLPNHALSAYNVDSETCTFRGDTKTMVFPKSIAAMTPEGCMIDFSGSLTGDKPVTKEQLNDVLLTFFDYMNKEDEQIITGLKSADQMKQQEIVERNKMLNDKDDEIQALDNKIMGKNEQIFLVNGEKPTWVYESSAKGWIYPRRGLEVAKFRDLGIEDPTKMSITFWIDINWPTAGLRNVFHVLKKRDTTNMNLVQKVAYRTYDEQEDMYRRPAIYILPKSAGVSSLVPLGKNTRRVANVASAVVNNGFTLQVAVDTDRMRNEHHNFKNIIGKCMIGLVWSGKTMTMYVDTTRQGSDIVQYWGVPIKADMDASLYVADRFTFGGDIDIKYKNSYKIRNLTFYNTALTSEMFKTKYEQERIMI